MERASLGSTRRHAQLCLRSERLYVSMGHARLGRAWPVPLVTGPSVALVMFLLARAARSASVIRNTVDGQSSNLARLLPGKYAPQGDAAAAWKPGNREKKELRRYRRPLYAGEGKVTFDSLLPAVWEFRAASERHILRFKSGNRS